MEINIKKKIFGVTLFLGKTNITTKYGEFICLTFLDIIKKNNIVALIKGDIYDKDIELYTRIHSSCITSETLTSQDCDCVEQLNGAIKKIAEMKNGIFFYLIQEGRGCGYIGKSRACSIVQESQDQLTTFDAYNMLGMKPDYRSYHNIKEILVILGIYDYAKFVLLTNNPDKINGMLELGIKVVKTESIQYKTNVFNQSYLLSKKKSGHKLNDLEIKTKLNKYIFPKKIKVFEPYYLKNNRYIYCSSYYIPIRPIDNWILFDQEQLNECKFINEYPSNQINKYLKKINNKNIAEQSLFNPYWFKVNVFFDIVTNQDIVILVHENDKKDDCTIPMVRYHSESIFDRFPLKKRNYHSKFINSIFEIVKNGYGIITLFQYDGKGLGLGYYLLNHKDMIQTSDNRDYNSVVFLSKNFLNTNKIKVLYSESSYFCLKNTLETNDIEVDNWIPYQKSKNFDGLEKRNKKLKKEINFKLEFNELIVNKNDKFIITGIGSSEYHCYYFMDLFKEKYNNIINFKSIDSFTNLNSNDTKLIVISQGLSPNIHKAIKQWQFKNIILISSLSAKKKDIFKSIENSNNQIFLYQEEKPDDTLVRIFGPTYVFKVINSIFKKDIKINVNLEKSIELNNKDLRNNEFYIITNSKYKKYFGNIGNKIMEMLMIKKPIIVDYYSFSHGYYQSSLYNKKNIVFVLDLSEEKYKTIMEMYIDHSSTNILHFNLNNIIEYEILVNNWLLEYVRINNINQSDWLGKRKQDLIYNIN
jgi:3,4-dihydroxy 2-butanone 4-phosphate synthase / GTP cyclohydrolase II